MRGRVVFTRSAEEGVYSIFIEGHGDRNAVSRVFREYGDQLFCGAAEYAPWARVCGEL